jgi:hypothetical protein
MLESHDPDASVFPSAENATLVTPSVCPDRVRKSIGFGVGLAVGVGPRVGGISVWVGEELGVRTKDTAGPLFSPPTLKIHKRNTRISRMPKVASAKKSDFNGTMTYLPPLANLGIAFARNSFFNG